MSWLALTPPDTIRRRLTKLRRLDRLISEALRAAEACRDLPLVEQRLALAAVDVRNEITCGADHLLPQAVRDFHEDA